MTQMAFAHSLSLSLSPSLSVSLSLSGFAAVATESRMRGGGSGSGEVVWRRRREGRGEEKRGERASDGTGKREIGESEPTGHVRRGFVTAAVCVLLCVCDWLCSNSERQKHKECVFATWLGTSVHSASDSGVCVYCMTRTCCVSTHIVV